MKNTAPLLATLTLGLALCNSPAAAILIEAGSVTATDTGVTVNFSNAYATAPVVVATATNQGSDPSSIRIRNVTNSSFDLVVVEPAGEDGPHADMTIEYVAAEQGTHNIGAGFQIDVGTFETSQTIASGDAANTNFDTFAFSTPFTSMPAVLANIQTTNNEVNNIGTEPSVPWMTANIRDITATGANVSLDRAETEDAGDPDPIVDETVGYIAITQGSGSFLDDLDNEILFDAFTSSGAPFNHSGGTGLASGGVAAFTQDFTGTPLTVATSASRNGSDGYFLRKNLSTTTADQIGLLTDEDQFADSERGHTGEDASILAFSQAFSANVLVPEPSTLGLLAVLGLMLPRASGRRFRRCRR